MRSGICTSVLTGDTLVLDNGQAQVRVRISNVWAPTPGTPLGDAMHRYSSEVVLGKTVLYVPNGHIHWEDQSIVAEVYLDALWLNQALRGWLSQRMHAPEWVNGIPGGDKAPD